MTNYLENIDLLKQLEPIMERLGVEADGYMIAMRIGDKTHTVIYDCLYDLEVDSGDIDYAFKLYRSDTLENVLPEWLYDRGLYLVGFLKMYSLSDEICEDIANKIRDTMPQLQGLRGQPKLEALAQLVILLDGEGLLEEKDE